jgi:SAM-dependent methyltransferase
MKTSIGYRVQYGCGFNAPSGWKNFDVSPTLRFERVPLIGRLCSKNQQRFPSNVEYGDIVKGIPLPSESCEAIYASHVLEHLSLGDFRAALANTYRLLASGGLFRLVVPDLELLARRYVESDDPTAAISFMEATSLGVSERQRGLRGLATIWLGNSSHLWMWDLKSISRELATVGFADIRRCCFGDEPVFRDVEEEGRFVDALAVQCRKDHVQ